MKMLPAPLRRLRDLPPFAACTDDELAFVAARIGEHRAHPGDVLTEEGRTGREWVVLVEGSAVVRVGSHVLTRLGPGDVVGEVALLDHGSRTATVVAETEVEALVSSAEEFTQILTGVPAVARALLVSLAGRLRAADDLLVHGVRIG